jgi:hypothetical protein
MINRKNFLKLLSVNTTGLLALNRLPLSALSHHSISADDSQNNVNLDKETTDPLHPNLYDAIKTFKIVESNDPNNLLILAYDLDYNIIDHLPRERNVAIFSYKTSFRDGSSINLDGKNFFLVSNTVDFQNTVISTVPDGAPDANPPQQKELDGLVVNRNNAPAPSGEDFAIDGSTSKKKDNEINGRNGGDITINCFSATGKLNLISKGADGGKGQTGAPGRNGANDRNLQDIAFFDPVKRPTEGIVNGFPGEIGGAGALGGFGGDGGSQRLFIPDNRVSRIGDASGGLQGESGDAGLSGASGIGLNHSIKGFVTPVHGGHEHSPGGQPIAVYWDTDVPSIANIAGRKLPNTQERKGMQGIVMQTAKDEFYKYIPVEFGKLLLLKAESLYLNSSYAKNDQNLNDAYELLSFIYTVAINNPGSAFQHAGQANATAGDFGTLEEGALFLKGSLYYLSDYKSEPKGWESIKQKSGAYINQIRLNLDFFGNPPNYAPELAYDFLAANFLDNYPLVKDFDTYAKEIANEKNGLRKDMISAENYVQQSNYNISDLDAKIANFKKSILDLNVELQPRFAVIEKLKTQLTQDEGDLQRAIQDMGGCSFGIVLKCLTAIVAIVAAVYTAGAAAGPAVAAVGSVVSGLEAINSLAQLKEALKNQNSVIRQGAKNVSDQMSTVIDDYNTVKNNVQVIQTAFKEKDAPAVAIPDYVIAVDTKKFDETIDKIIDDPNLSDHAKSQAARYKADYHYFTDYVMVTNQKRLEITADVLGISEAYHERELQQQQKDRYNQSIIDDIISLGGKQDLFEMYYNILTHVSYLDYLRRKALAYQYPENAGVQSGDQFDHSDMNQFSASAFSDNWKYILNFNDPKSSLRPPKSTLSPLVIEFIKDDASNLNKHQKWNYVSHLSHQDFKTALRDDEQDIYYSLHFDILPTKTNHNYVFLGAYNIKVRGLVIYLKSRTQEYKEIKFRLTHLGNSIVTKDRDLNQVQFFEEPRTIVLYSNVSPQSQERPSFETRMGDSTSPQSNLIDGTSSGQIAQMGRSPFASWKLDIPKGYNSLSEGELESLVSDLSGIEVYFYYTYQQG